MGWEAWTTLGVIAAVAGVLMRGRVGPDTALLAGLAVLMGLGTFSAQFPGAAAAVAGFGNEAVVTIGVLFVIAEGLSRTGAMARVARPVLGQPTTARGAQARLLPAVASLSAFLNNTPIVAMFIPVVRDWSRRSGIAESKLLIPLSYAAILGGSCTLIGTATNVLVDGLVRSSQADGQLLGPLVEGQRTAAQLGLFSITAVGLPAAVLGLVYLWLVSDRWLPDRRPPADGEGDAGHRRQFTVEMLVSGDATFVGQTVQQAGLRSLPGAYLVGIERDGDRLVAVGPEQTVRGGDRLIFAGVVDAVVQLQQIRGLVPATDQVFKLDDPRPNRRLVEAVVSPSNPLVGQTIREGRFRTQYGAAVIAVYRGGEALNQRLGDVRLRAGDTLLLETHPRFVDRQRNRQDFVLVSAVAGSEPARPERAWVALAWLVGMVLLAALTPMRLVTAALLSAGGMVLTGCLTAEAARQAVQWRVLLAMGAALGMGSALSSTGAATRLAEGMIELFSAGGPRAILAAVYISAMGLTSLIGPIGTVALMFPIARAAAMGQGLNFEPFAVSLMMTAAASFATPTAYQTNLMVYGIGGYRFADFIRLGVPLNLLVMAVTLVIAPWVWPMI